MLTNLDVYIAPVDYNNDGYVEDIYCWDNEEYDKKEYGSGNSSNSYGRSVRCVKD